ncbi:hypothetical protein B0H11DRAFT_724791 [Mycena galericulata]|nr:hypothetical protein B0H11DRAFT_724791 [Mycena galericulata]
MASPNCTNTDISGIGVRSATYAQNLLSFVPAVIALLNDGKISNNEREFIQDQSTNILLTAFGLLLSAIVQAKTAQGLDNYHLALVLNLSWMNNTNTFIYLLLFLHRKIWSSASYSWSWRRTISQIFRRSSKPKTGDESSQEESPPGKKTAPGKSPPGNEYAPEEESEPLLDLAVCIGSLHLSLMGALGIWLWLNPEGFGSSLSCPPGATISLFSHAFPMGSHVLRVFSLIVYIAVLIPIANLVLPTALILVPYFLCPLGKWDRSHRERVAVWCVALGLTMLFTINVIFIVDTELSISRNESRQADQDEVWTLGQTLALLLLVLPIKSLIQYLLTTTSFTLPFMGVTAWGRAVQGFLTYNEKVEWGEVYRWRWIIRDTPIKVDSDWLLRAVAEKQWDIVRFLHENGADWDTGLVHAVEKGAFKVVRSLVERGANVNYRDYFGQTPLHLAAEHGYSDIASFLVEHGADVNSENISGETLLHLAAEHNHLDIASFLFQHNAEVNIRGTPSFN